jgi:putrescine aminotransferase
LACAAACAAIGVLKRDKLAERAASVGEAFLAKLRALAAEYPEVIKEVRGKGLMIGIELTKEGVGGMLMNELIAGGVLVAYTLNNPKVIRMEPPLTIDDSQLDTVMEVLRRAVAASQEVIEDL